MKTYKFKLYPTKKQQRLLTQTLNSCRWLYNYLLAYRRNAWEEKQESLSFYDTTKILTKLKKEKIELLNIHSQALQVVCMRLDLAFKSFFRRVKKGEKPGYPRFKGYNQYDSFTYPQSGFKIIKDNKLYLSKIGFVKIKLYQNISGNTKQLTIKRDGLGNWFACFVCETDKNILPETSKTIGIDVGLESFATFSTGEKIDNPRFFRKDEKELANAQRKMSKSEKGSAQRKKYKRVVQHIHKRICNRRQDFAHKLSRKIVNEYQLIVFENLNINKMLKNDKLSKSISDASWNQFVKYTIYKAENAGRSVILVNPHNTSKACSRCGTLVEKDLSQRIHSCSNCGLVIDRDINAAINILARGLASLGKIPRNSNIIVGE